MLGSTFKVHDGFAVHSGLYVYMDGYGLNTLNTYMDMSCDPSHGSSSSSSSVGGGGRESKTSAVGGARRPHGNATGGRLALSRAAGSTSIPRVQELRMSANLTWSLSHDSRTTVAACFAMSRPLSPVVNACPRLSRRCMQCGQPVNRCPPAPRRWMSGVRDAPIKRPKTAIFFPGTIPSSCPVLAAQPTD